MSSASLDTIVTAIIGKDHTSEVLCIDKFLGDDAIRLLSSRLAGNKLKHRLVLRGNCIGPTGEKSNIRSMLSTVVIKMTVIYLTRVSLLIRVFLRSTVIVYFFVLY